MWHEAALVAGKDLRIEARSKIGASHVVPFALVVLVIFAFALDPSSGLLVRAAPGLFWVAVTFSAVIVVQRSFQIESSEGAADGLRMSGMDPGGIFLGKTAALAGQLVVLEAVLGVGAIFLYNPSVHRPWLLVLTAALATLGLSAAGVLYGMVASGLAVRETLLPLLLLPVLAPVLLAATQAWGAAMGDGGSPGPWLELLGVFAAVYLSVGVAAFGPLMEVS